MTYNEVMIKVNINEAKAKFAYYLRLAQQGEKIVICKRNIPIVEWNAALEDQPKREFGHAQRKYNWTVDMSAAADPLDEETVKAFEDSPIFPENNGVAD